MRPYEPKTALIIANGLMPSDQVVKPCVEKAHVVVCADGGANLARDRHIRPDIIIGDFDSILPETRQYFASNVREVYIPDQNRTDLEKALAYTVEMKVEKAMLVGVAGLRFDHTLDNLNVVQKFCRQIEIEWYDDFGMGLFLTPESQVFRPSFSLEIGQQISLIAFQRAEGITASGLKYSLSNDTLEWGIRDGQSNEINNLPVTISIRSGVVFIYCVAEVKKRPRRHIPQHDRLNAS